MFSEIIDRVKENPLVKKYIKGEFTEKIYFLSAEGGYGKSTSLKALYYYLVEQGTQANNHIVPIFIDVKQLVEFGEKGSAGNMPRPIEKYIVKHYCGEDSDPNESLLEKVVNLFSKNNAPKFQNHYTYFIFLDAINEVNDRQKQTIIDEIKQMAESDSVKFIISSRVNESSLPDDTVKYKLLPLDEENIRVYLDKNFGKTGEKVDISRINDLLVDILRVPMHLSVFRETYDEKTPYPDIYEAKTVRKADILDSFIQKLLDDSKGKERSADKAVIEFVVKYFLPALAFLMANTNGFIIDSDSTEKLNCDYFKKFFLGTKKEVIKNLMNSEAYNPLSICCKTFSLLIENGDNFSFTHQNWRDLFVAKHIINCMNAEKLDELETPVSENVRQFAGELIREHKDDCGYSKDYMDKSDAENARKSECDFEEKDNLKVFSASPVEDFLQKHNLKSQSPLSAMATKNLIDVMKTSRNGNITANYRHLNLSKVTYEYTNIYSSDFRGAILNSATFKASHYMFTDADEEFSLFSQVNAVSPNGELYACASGYNVYIFYTDTGMEYLYTGFSLVCDNIRIEQIAFLSNTVLLVRYPHCLIFFDIKHEIIYSDFVFYIQGDRLCSYKDYLDGNINLFIRREYKNMNQGKQYLKHFLDSFDRQIAKAILSESKKACAHGFRGENFEAFIDRCDDFDNFDDSLFYSNKTREEMDEANQNDFTPLFLYLQGDEFKKFGNFTFDKTNKTLYICANNNVYLCKLDDNYFPKSRFFKWVAFGHGKNIVSIGGAGLLVIPDINFKWPKKFFRLYYINKERNICCFNLNEKLITFMESHVADFECPYIEEIYLNAYKPVLKVKYDYYFKGKWKKNSGVAFFDLKKMCFLINTEDVINDQYHYIISTYGSDIINDYYHLNQRYELNKRYQILCYDKHAKYIMVHHRKMQKEMCDEIQLLRFDNFNLEKIIGRTFVIENISTKMIDGKYIFLYIPSCDKSMYYDIKNEMFHIFHRNSSELTINDESTNESITLFNFGRDITIQPNNNFFVEMRDPASNKVLYDDITCAKIRNIMKFLDKEGISHFKLNLVNSGNFTYFYYNEDLYVNLIFKTNSDGPKVSLRKFNDKNSVVDNEYLMFYGSSDLSIRIFDLRTGALIGSQQKYPLDNILKPEEVERISRFGLGDFVKVKNVKLYISDKIFIHIDSRVIILDKQGQNPPKTLYCNKEMKLTTRKLLFKGDCIIRIGNRKLVLFDFITNERFIIDNNIEYVDIFNCRGGLFITKNVYNELSIWDSSSFNLKEKTKFFPIVTIPLHYLVSFGVYGAKFDGNSLPHYQKEIFKLLGAELTD